MAGLDIVLREMLPGDRNLVLSTWVGSYAKKQQGISRRAFVRLYVPVVYSLVDKSKITIAGMPDMGDTILGWMAMDADNLHYVFVKPRWRRLRVASALLSGMESRSVVYTHEPLPRMRIPSAWRYDPLARFASETPSSSGELK